MKMSRRSISENLFSFECKMDTRVNARVIIKKKSPKKKRMLGFKEKSPALIIATSEDKEYFRTKNFKIKKFVSL